MDTKELQKLLGDGKLEVVEDGKQVANPQIDPSPMSFLLQAAQLGQLVKIRKYFDDRTSHGFTQTWGSDSPLTVTDALTEIKLDFVAQSASLINDGADDVYVRVNTVLMPSHKVKRRESYDIDFETHKLNYLYLQCASGETASVRIVAND